MDALKVGLYVNSTELIMKMDKPMIKDINKRLGYLIYPNNTAADRVDCSLQTMKSIYFLDISVQELEKRGLPEYVTLL